MDIDPIVEIIFEDDFLIAVNKPTEVLVHHSHYARNIKGKSLVELLLEQKGQKYFPIHRLDYKTTGLLLLAKNQEFVSKFQNILSNQSKKYLAICRGYVEGNGVIDSPVKPKDASIHKEAYSEYSMSKTFDVPHSAGKYPRSRYSLVEFLIKTGRRHQIRIHAAKIKHPIIGDHKYGDRHHNKLFSYSFDLPQMFLHSESIDFIHPFTSESLSLRAKLPEFWSVVLNFLEQESEK